MPRRLSITLSEELYNDYKKKSEKRGVSMSSIISAILHEYVKQEAMIDHMKNEQWVKAMKKYSEDE